MKVALFVALFVACAFAQGPFTNAQLRLIVDDFTVNVGQRAVVELENDLLSGNPIVEQTSTNSAGCSGLVGCARDMEMRVFTGLNGRTFESEIFSVPGTGYFDGEWAIANPKTSTALATNQYDGNDGTFDLDITGLGGVDVTDGGNTEFFFFSAVSDIEITFTVDLYDMDGDVCELNIDLPSVVGNYDYEDTFYEFDLNEFSNGCDMTNVGAIEVSLPSQDAVDVIVRLVAFVGNPPATPSQTPTGTRTPSPVPNPSESNTPTPPPERFTWYTFDDDDDGRSPCGDEPPRKTYFVSDDNIIYYYFFGAYQGQRYAVETGSPASVLSVCFALIATIVALII